MPPTLRSREGRPAPHLFTALLKCDTCGSNFVRINQRDYRCATYTNGGKAACGNAIRLNAAGAPTEGRSDGSGEEKER
jgi:hypothetical protein